MSGKYADGTGAATRDVPPLREDRVFETASRPTREHRIMELLAPFRRTNFPLAQPVRDFDATVRSALAGVNVMHVRPQAFPVQEMKDVYAKLPFSVREEAKAGVRKGFQQAMAVPVPALLKRATGWEPDIAVLAATAGKGRLFEAMAEHVDDATGGFLPAALTEGLPQTIAYAIVALASGREAHFGKIEAFLALFRAGNVPVGVLTDNTLLVMTR